MLRSIRQMYFCMCANRCRRRCTSAVLPGSAVVVPPTLAACYTSPRPATSRCCGVGFFTKKSRATLTHFVASLSFVMPFHSGIVGRPKRRSECFIGEETQTKPTTNIKNGATHQPSHAKGAEGTRFGECRPPRNNHHHIIITCHEIVAPTFASRRGLQDNPCTIPRRCMRRGFGSRCHR